MSMSQGYGSAVRQESERALHRALDVGYTFLDTASVYGLGHNESLIGEVLGLRRNEFVLASKCGIVNKDGKRGVDCSPENVLWTLDESLQRLGTDHIDLYYLHRRDFDVPIEESVGALSTAVKAGKIGHIGLSECSSETIRKAHPNYPSLRNKCSSATNLINSGCHACRIYTPTRLHCYILFTIDRISGWYSDNSRVCSETPKLISINSIVRNKSSPPSSGKIKPNPLALLNHFTCPVLMELLRTSYCYFSYIVMAQSL